MLKDYDDLLRSCLYCLNRWSKTHPKCGTLQIKKGMTEGMLFAFCLIGFPLTTE